MSLYKLLRTVATVAQKWMRGLRIWVPPFFFIMPLLSLACFFMMSSCLFKKSGWSSFQLYIFLSSALRRHHRAHRPIPSADGIAVLADLVRCNDGVALVVPFQTGPSSEQRRVQNRYRKSETDC